MDWWKNITQGLGSLFGGVGNIASNAGKGISSLLGNWGGGTTGGSSVRNAVAQSPVAKLGGSMIKPMATPQTQSGSASLSPFSGMMNPGSLLQNINYPGAQKKNLMSNMLGAVQKPEQTASPVGASPMKGMIDELFNGKQGGGISPVQIGAGLAIPAIGNMMAPKVKVPDMAQNQYAQKLAQVQTRNLSQLDPEMEKKIREDQAIANRDADQKFLQMWASARPGSDVTSDSTMARAWQEHKQSQAESNTGEMAKVRFENMQNQLQASNLEMQQLAQLAQMDQYTIMMQLGLDAQAAQEFKDVFSGIGTQFLNKGMGTNQMMDKFLQRMLI